MNQPRSSSTTTPQSDEGLLDQAQQWVSQDSMSDMLGRVSPSLKDAGNKALTSFNKLSTTQKVVGGALLVLGVTYLTRRGSSKEDHADTHGKAETLHELLHFVNDRIEGYQHAVAESQDPKLRGYYKQLVSQSQQFANQLNAYLRQQDGGHEDGTTLKGKFYRAWMDTKAAIVGRDEKAILGSNIYGEEWALKAYEDALDDHTLTGALRVAVERQYTQSQKTYKELKKLEAKQ